MTIEEALDWANNHRGNPWSKNTSMIAMWTLADEVRRLQDEIKTLKHHPVAHIQD